VEEHDSSGCCGGSRWRRKPLGLLLLLWGEERQWEAAAEADERAEGVGGHEGTQGPPDGQVQPSPAHGVHAAARVCRGRARRAGEGGEAWAGVELGRLALVGQKRGGGPVSKKTFFFSKFNSKIFLTALNFKF
jgi:hypothetical protein